MSDTPRNLVAVIAEVLEIPAADLADSSSPESVSGWDSAKSRSWWSIWRTSLNFNSPRRNRRHVVRRQIRKLLIAKVCRFNEPNRV